MTQIGREFTYRTSDDRQLALDGALVLARRHERETGDRFSVLHVQPDRLFRVVSARSCPILCEWYDSDGIRHG